MVKNFFWALAFAGLSLISTGRSAAQTSSSAPPTSSSPSSADKTADHHSSKDKTSATKKKETAGGSAAHKSTSSKTVRKEAPGKPGHTSAKSSSSGAHRAARPVKGKPGAKGKKVSAAEVHRARRLNRAFVASSDLRPMARQLLQDRSRPAYEGVQAYARRHPDSDAGALAWLALGYAHNLDKEYPQAVDSLRRAQTHAGDLGDYVAYFLAGSYSGQGNSSAVVATLRDFATKYPDSLLLRDAMEIYGTALSESGSSAEAVRVLEKYRLPASPDYELAIGRAYGRSGDFGRAAEAFKRVYYAFPLSPQAGDAKVELDRLVAQGTATPATFAERKSRADLLAQGRRNGDAATEYRALLNEAAAADRDALTIALGVALHRSGDDRQARSLLQAVPTSPTANNALRLFSLAEMARSAKDDEQFLAIVDSLRQNATTSEYFEQALLLGGNMYLLRPDYDRAIDFYRELQERFPDSKRAAYARWKAAWLSLRLGRTEEAKKGFEEEVATYPNAPEVPGSIYWRARLAEADGDFAKAQLWYRKLRDRFRNFYYSELAGQRLQRLTASISGADLRAVSLERDPILDKIPPAVPPAGYEISEPPADNIRVQKSRLLQNGGLTDFAVRELRAAAAEDGGTVWASIQIARIYQENSQYHRALQTLKRAVPNYYALDVKQLPRSYWEGLFPRPFWTDVRRFASQNELDPYLVASLIRQESEFNPGAVSRANALGLMQLLPVTGRKVAHELRVRKFSTNDLLAPAVNLQLGTRYFRAMVNQFGGNVQYALAAYNAGADRVQGWLSAGRYRDTEEFVESIPFTETREYVQAIMRNAMMYRQLYSVP